MSKQLTPMQELIEWMDKNKGHCTYGTIRLEANKLLPAERKMVEDEMEREAVGFAEMIVNYQKIMGLWVCKDIGILAHGSLEYYKSITKKHGVTTAQLYQIYKESQSIQK